MGDVIGRISAEFPAAAGGYLNTPSVGVPPRRTVAAVEEALRRWSTATAHFEEWDEVHARCRTLMAGQTGVSKTDVALLPSVVPAVSYVATALAARGGTLVAHRTEFRSLLLPALQAFGEDRVRWVEGPYTSATFAAALDADVSAVVVSSVSSHDGARVDLGSLLGACHAVGTELVIDATQSAGVVGLGVPANQPAAVVFAGYKGLLGPRGAAYGIIRPDLVTAAPAFPSPYGMADTADAGTYGPPVLPKPGASGLDQSPAWFSWVGARESLELLGGTSLADRERHTLGLAEELRDRLAEAGFPVTRGDLPSPVVSVPVERGEQVLAELDSAGIRASVRLGFLRLGFHLYVAPETVAKVVDVLVTHRDRAG
ncbi:aminotransferase class V-fold PLP-dependent enzyme [Ornithinicoccus halotolerans]|uniref:aminotransferase class V-fold PLP-dependent enzyme n=1 Tax=Ornithinicoccus halotolerans TaxID=1748220 RepID=UPI001295FDAA|nr:aminotransferase class V-fold PLP-dependent enzyme [Ornithinicoccus halotolerans]